MKCIDAAIRDKKEIGVIRMVMEELVVYAEFHLREEENLMKGQDYPWLADHRAQHRYFLTNICLMKSVCYTDQLPLAESIIHFLSIWLIDHVFCEDMKYGAFLKSGIANSALMQKRVVGSH